MKGWRHCRKVGIFAAFLWLILLGVPLGCRAEKTPIPPTETPTVTTFPATPTPVLPTPTATATPLLPTSTPTVEPLTLPLGFHIAKGNARHMAAARAAGGQFVVIVFSWAEIEPTPGYIYWQTPDAALRAAEFYGLKVIVRLDQPPAWAATAAGPTPWQLDAYVAFVRQVAERYAHRLSGVIIWNEPNLNLEWAGQPPDAAAYAEMLKAAYPTIKAVAPDLPVLMGGLASTEGEGDWAINDLDYLTALYAAGAGPYFDALTTHPYGFGRAPDDPPEKYHPNFRRLELYHQIMAANGDEAKPVWVTEMAWLTHATAAKHEWQVVTPQTQANYTLAAIEYAAKHYPWLAGLTLWHLDDRGDIYGYPLWHGPDNKTPAYDALVANCERYRPDCRIDPAQLRTDSASAIDILAPDVIVRLGDRDQLYPHWVHLYQSESGSSLAWQGEFFLPASQVNQTYDLLLETMQVDQPNDPLLINGQQVAYLHPRSLPDPTSAWVTQRLSLPGKLLQPGLNTIGLTVGLRNQLHQHGNLRWDNFQARNVRLILAASPPTSISGEWQPQPSPGSWAELSRLRPGLNGQLWLISNQPGGLWQVISEAEPGLRRAVNQAGNRPDLIFTDLLSTPDGELAAAIQGLFWRPAGSETWQPVLEMPASHVYALVSHQQRFYAGFEGAGLWAADRPTGPWQLEPLPADSVFDVTPAVERLFASTEAGVFLRHDRDASWELFAIPTIPDDAFDLRVEDPKEKLKVKLYPTEDGELIIRQQDRLWRFDGSDWTTFGPENLQGRTYSQLDCCEAGMLLGTNRRGLWHLAENGEWLPQNELDFAAVGLTDLLHWQGTLYALSDLTLFYSNNGTTWQMVQGLPSVVSDVVVDPRQPDRWLAGTPVGLYRSQDGGRNWQSISPAWPVWDLAFGPGGRFFAATSIGLVWADDLRSDPVAWQISDGLRQVFFFSVAPHPTDPNLIWAGTWGNNVAASQDGGQSVEPIHHGLETLSVLDLIWHATPGQVTVGTIEGLYRTDDGGQNWFQLPGPLSHQTIHSLLQGDDGAIWAGAADGLWVSHDYGVNWQRIDTLLPATVLRLGRLDRAGESWLWAGTEAAGLWLSQDDGQTWESGGLEGRSVYALFVDPMHPDSLVAATDSGIMRTTFDVAAQP